MLKCGKGIFLVLLLAINLFAVVTKVGNGDDGGDLENLSVIKSGKIYDARERAIELLKRLNVDGIEGLGSLSKELKNSEMYMAKEDVRAKLASDMSPFHSGIEGKVYARTIAQPYAATRFFPISLKLSDEALVALLVHEALHRALPVEIREDESKVSELALAINAPEATYDSIKVVAKKIIPGRKNVLDYHGENSMREESDLSKPSQVSLGSLYYFSPKYNVAKQVSLPVENSFLLSSYLYPFGKGGHAFGTGIDIVVLRDENGEAYMGPLGLSARLQLFTVRNFDVDGFAFVALNTLSKKELDESLLGRDIYSLGVTIKRELDYFYIVNDLSYTFPSSVDQKVANSNYKYKFGDIVMARIKLGGRYKQVHLGGFGEVYLANNLEMEGFEYERGRTRVLAVGPELYWRSKSWQLGVVGRYLLDSTKDVDFDDLGNIIGVGAGQGYMGAKFSLFF